MSVDGAVVVVNTKLTKLSTTLRTTRGKYGMGLISSFPSRQTRSIVTRNNVGTTLGAGSRGSDPRRRFASAVGTTYNLTSPGTI